MYYVIRDGQVVNTIELYGMAREAYEQLEGVLLVEDKDAPEVRIGDAYDEETGTFLRDGVSLAGLITRTMRDNLLKACDYRMMPDYPCSEESRAAWAAYRQALRDVPQQEGFPETIEWPQAPDGAHAGTADDPIPYEGNMALENGKYYSQDGVVYRCTRDTGNPVFHALSELVGLYVEVV